MLNGREALGNNAIDWKMGALGIGKRRRKTIGFGKFDKKTREYEDEIYIRELSITEGGVGCAVWDAAIILSRWIMEKNELWKDKRILELGSGVGLPGICLSRFAKKVYLTDYVDIILDNIRYNIYLNTNFDETDEMDENMKRSIEIKKKMRDTAVVEKLDWYNIDEVHLEPFDIIIGSELTYTGSEECANALVKVIKKFLKEDGVFIEILSDDRDGVPLFCNKIEEEGYELRKVPVKPKYMENLKNITKQREETYKIYFWTKKSEQSKQILDIYINSL